MFRFGWAVISSVISAILVARLRRGSSSISLEDGGSSETKVHRLQSTSQRYSSISSPEPKQLNDYVHEIFNPSGLPSIEVVFFHGLQLEGSEKVYINTWISRDGSQLWLKWIVDAYPKARILVISYDASVELTDHQGLTDMYITRENLVQCLTTGAASVGQQGCPVILVGHGMGGLVLKEVCVQANSIDSLRSTVTVQKLLRNIKGLFFYATPHHGSQLADTSTRASKGLLFQDITTLNPQASRRNQEFSQLRRKFGWKAYGIGESFPITVQGFRGLVVEEASARYDVDSFYTASADHFNVCRPASTKCSSFDILSNFVADILKEGQGRAGPQIDLGDKIVGLDEPVKKLLDTLEGNARLAIVGMGGLGKTTLAKAVFNSIKRDFEYTCFIADFKTKVPLNLDPSELRRVISQNMWYGYRWNVYQPTEWSALRGKKVLIVLDDVESESHVLIMTNSDSFADESRVIVTSRDKRFLISENFECHFHELLNDQDSTRLFCLNAFKMTNVPTGYEQHVEQFVKKCGGLPLALIVAGKYLYSREQGELWDDALKKLSEAWSLSGVNNQIDPLWSILEVTYDSLAESEREMFLDIATCFHGDPLADVQGGAWRLCRWASPYSGWENLVDKGLVTTKRDFSPSKQGISEKGYYPYVQCIQMHELLRDWGRKKAGYSRVCCRLPNIPQTWPLNEANPEVKVLTIGCGIGDTEYEPQLIRGVGESKYFSLEVNRLFGIGIEILQGLDMQLKALSYLELRKCRWSSLPHTFGQLKDLSHLQVVDCDLRSLPESFGQLEALSHLVLKYCCNLQTLPDAFGQLESLTHLEFVGCPSLRSLPKSFGQLEDLSYLVFWDCGILATLPESFVKLKSLSYLGFCRCGLRELPEDLGQLKTLSGLELRDCQLLQSLPESLGQLTALNHLEIHDCQLLQSLPESLGQLTALNHLEICDCELLQNLPESLGQLTALNYLEIRRCKLLQSLPESLGYSLL